MARRRARRNEYFEVSPEGTVTVLKSGTYVVSTSGLSIPGRRLMARVRKNTRKAVEITFELARSSRRSGTSSSSGRSGAAAGRSRTSGRRSGSAGARR